MASQAPGGGTRDHPTESQKRILGRKPISPEDLNAIHVLGKAEGKLETALGLKSNRPDVRP